MLLSIQRLLFSWECRPSPCNQRIDYFLEIQSWSRKKCTQTNFILLNWTFFWCVFYFWRITPFERIEKAESKPPRFPLLCDKIMQMPFWIYGLVIQATILLLLPYFFCWRCECMQMGQMNHDCSSLSLFYQMLHLHWLTEFMNQVLLIIQIMQNWIICSIYALNAFKSASRTR